MSTHHLTGEYGLTSRVYIETQLLREFAARRNRRELQGRRLEHIWGLRAFVSRAKRYVRRVQRRDGVRR